MSTSVLLTDQVSTEVLSANATRVEIFNHVYYQNQNYLAVYKLQLKYRKKITEDTDFRKQELSGITEVIARCNQAKLYLLSQAEKFYLVELLKNAEFYKNSSIEYNLLIMELKRFKDTEIQKRANRFIKQNGLKF